MTTRVSVLLRPMLAWRTVSRPAIVARRAITVLRRPIHVSVPRAQPQVQPTFERPSGLLAKIRFRADGKPRSRLVGAAFGTLLLTNLLTLLTMYDLVDDSEIALGLLAGVIYVQKVDRDFEKVDFQNTAATYNYFKKLYHSLTRIPEEEVDELFLNFDRMMKAGGAPDTEAQTHEIMRKAAAQIHRAFEELSDDSIASVAGFVLTVMKEALEALIDLIQDAQDDDSDTKYTFQLIKDRSKKDPGAVLKDYEVLG